MNRRQNRQQRRQHQLHALLMDVSSALFQGCVFSGVVNVTVKQIKARG